MSPSPRLPDGAGGAEVERVIGPAMILSLSQSLLVLGLVLVILLVM